MPHQVRASMKTDCSCSWRTFKATNTMSFSLTSAGLFLNYTPPLSWILSMKMGFIEQHFIEELHASSYYTGKAFKVLWKSCSTRLQFGLHERNNCMFTVYLCSNLSVLCCKCQFLSYFIGYYFCFMEQFSHPARMIVASLSASRGRAGGLMNTQHEGVIMEC